ncbi:MAG: RsmB/NOP family class I SAM-dependent RNA methyltransferase [Alphaproteobacteria bacterium]|nr:RsmB/NOP family class I SAM-dependent RNA methyltransferase [Alphaproteobacteria bacterium]
MKKSSNCSKKTCQHGYRNDASVGLVKDNLKQSFQARMSRLLNVSEHKLSEILKPYDCFTCRLNRLRNTTRAKVIDTASKSGIILEPLSWYPDAFLVKTSKYNLVTTDLVKGGVLYIQNASSYLPVLALQPETGDSILDACAAPGGKSSHIAALTGGNIDLWLNDGIVSRIENIKQVEKLLGFKHNKLTTFPVQTIDKEIHQQFDKILLDIQCSGEGMMDITKPFTMRFWSMDRIKKYMYLQTKALNACFKLLKPGGTLVYSTCTFAPEENEAPISNLLKHNPDAVIQPLLFDSKFVRPGERKWDNFVFNPQLSGALRVLPSPGMEGFFLCRIRKAIAGEKFDSINLKSVGQKYAEITEKI